MFSKKYLKDYKTNYDFDENGKEQRTIVYTGKYYGFGADKRTFTSARTLFTVCAALMCALFVFPFVCYTDIMRGYFVVFPHLFCFWPIGYLCVAVVYLYTTKAPFVRERRDKTEHRIGKTLICNMLFSGVCLLASAAHCITNGFAAGDLCALIPSAALVGISAFLFSKKSAFKTVEVDTDVDEKEYV